MADGAENRDREQGKEQKPQAQISFFVRNEAAHKAMKRRKVIDRNNEEHEAVTVSWNWRDTWQNEHKRAFVVAKMAKADMLTEVHDSLQKALDEGVPFEQWKKEIVPKLEGKWLGRSVGELWDELSDEEKAKREPPSEKQREKIIAPERLELIFRTNMAVANAAGHYEQLMKTKAIYPYWRYVTRDDARVRDAHRALHNKVFKWDDPFWETYFPPNGFRCRCHVSPLTKRQAERDPKLHIEQSNIAEDADGRKVLDVGGSYYKNNPGWDYNPGDGVNHLVSLAKSNEKGRPAQVQADLEADLAKREAEEQRKAAEAAARAEAERLAHEAAKARAEAERKAKEAAAKAEAERQAKEAAAKAEAERQAKEAAAKAEAERQAKEAAAKAEAERLEAEKKAKEEERRKAEEAEKARKEAEKVKKEAERQAKTQEVNYQLQNAMAKAEQRKQLSATLKRAKQESEQKIQHVGHINGHEAKPNDLPKPDVQSNELPKQQTKAKTQIIPSIIDNTQNSPSLNTEAELHQTATLPTTKGIHLKEIPLPSNWTKSLGNIVDRFNPFHKANPIEPIITEREQEAEEIITKIIGNYESHPKYKGLKKDLHLVLDSCSDDDRSILRLVARLSTDNDLFHDISKTEAGYIPKKRLIKINLTAPRYERRIGNEFKNDIFAWGHETFHMLEHHIDLNNKVLRSNTLESFLDLSTAEGQQFHDAAFKDISAFIRDCTDYDLGFIMSSRCGETDLKLIRERYAEYLKTNITIDCEKVYVGIMTDALGIITKGSLSIDTLLDFELLKNRPGYFGHDNNYNQTANCNSEIWANMGGARLRKHETMIARQKLLFPATYDVFVKYVQLLTDLSRTL